MITIQGLAGNVYENPVAITATQESKICIVLSYWSNDGSHSLGFEAISYNGNAMILHTLNGSYGIGGVGISLWYYLNPPVGAGTIQPDYGNSPGPTNYGYSVFTLGNIDQINFFKEIKIGSWSGDGTYTLTHTASDVNGLIITARSGMSSGSGPVGYSLIGSTYYKTTTIINESNIFTGITPGGVGVVLGISASIKSGNLKSGVMHFT